MADLIAQGTETQQRWRRTLPDDQPVVLGRAAGVWSIPWDPHVSRQQVEVAWREGRLKVKQLPAARNPIFFRGKEATEFSLEPGEHFVVGQTTFTVVDQRVQVAGDAPQPVQQQTYSSQYLRQIPFRNPDYRIEVLSRLPDVIWGAAGPSELCVRLVSMLLAGLPRADTAAVVEAQPEPSPTKGDSPEFCGVLPQKSGQSPPRARSRVRVLHWDQRLLTGGDFHPSERLISEALRQKQSVLHVWRGGEPSSAQAFTVRGNFDWAFCAPVLGEASQGWVLYVAGRFNVDLPGMPGSSDANDLREDIKFTELVAAMLSSLRQMQMLNRQHAIVSQFLSPIVLDTLSTEDPDVVLAPRETEISVLFCDLRGFSRHSERHAGDLLELVNRVSKALGVMTHQIREQGGVVGDFQGDAAMGFWGWPLAQPDAVLRTCRAALAIRSEFDSAAKQPGSPLAGFHAGIGVATGRAVAGRIGTVDHVKITVFGPVVNLASRLEGMTKVLRAPVLLDQATTEAVRKQVPRDVARVRRLAVVRPYGLDTPLEVSELLPPAAQYPLLSDEHLATYEAALDAFLAGRWSAAYELLHRIPADDEVADFLTVFIAEHKRTPPTGWNGVIPLSSK
jgi:adenylate cyclase